MNGIAGRLTFDFLERFAEVFQELPVDEFDFTFGTQGAYESRDAVENFAEIIFP